MLNEARHIYARVSAQSESSMRSYSRQLPEPKTREISQTLTSLCAQGSIEIIPLGTEVEQSIKALSAKRAKFSSANAQFCYQ